MSNSMQKALAALALHPRCGAHCRTTGMACRNAEMPNGRCRMHGGKATGRPVTHGRCTQKAKAKRREVRELLRGLREAMAAYGISKIS